MNQFLKRFWKFGTANNLMQVFYWVLIRISSSIKVELLFETLIETIKLVVTAKYAFKIRIKPENWRFFRLRAVSISITRSRECFISEKLVLQTKFELRFGQINFFRSFCGLLSLNFLMQDSMSATVQSKSVLPEVECCPLKISLRKSGPRYAY